MNDKLTLCISFVLYLLAHTITDEIVSFQKNSRNILLKKTFKIISYYSRINITKGSSWRTGIIILEIFIVNRIVGRILVKMIDNYWPQERFRRQTEQMFPIFKYFPKNKKTNISSNIS